MKMQTAINKTIVTPDSVTFHFQLTFPVFPLFVVSLRTIVFVLFIKKCIVVTLFVRKQSLKKVIHVNWNCSDYVNTLHNMFT